MNLFDFLRHACLVKSREEEIERKGFGEFNDVDCQSLPGTKSHVSNAGLHSWEGNSERLNFSDKNVGVVIEK